MIWISSSQLQAWNWWPAYYFHVLSHSLISSGFCRTNVYICTHIYATWDHELTTELLSNQLRMVSAGYEATCLTDRENPGRIIRGRGHVLCFLLCYPLHVFIYTWHMLFCVENLSALKFLSVQNKFRVCPYIFWPEKYH